MGNIVTIWNKPRCSKPTMWQLVWEVSSVSCWKGSHLVWCHQLEQGCTSCKWSWHWQKQCQEDSRTWRLGAWRGCESALSQPLSKGQSGFSTGGCQGTRGVCAGLQGHWNTGYCWGGDAGGLTPCSLESAGATALLSSLGLCFNPFKSFVSWVVQALRSEGGSEKYLSWANRLRCGASTSSYSGSIVLLKLQKAWWSYNVFTYI